MLFSGHRKQKTDAELTAAAQSGDRKSFVEIVERFQSLVCGVSYGILNDAGASEDAAQDTFFLAWKKIGDLKKGDRLRPWLAQIARNVSLRKLGGTRPMQSPEVLNEIADDAPLPSESAATDDEVKLVNEHLASLPEKYRLPMVLYYREEQSARLVGEALGLSEATVRKRLSRGREKLRERMTHLVEDSLRKSGPGTAFTTMVAAGLLNIKAPTAAASVVTASSSSVGSVAASSSVSLPIFSVMSITKVSYVMAGLVTAVCLQLGYFVQSSLEERSDDQEPRRVNISKRIENSPLESNGASTLSGSTDPSSRLGILERIAKASLEELPDLSRELLTNLEPKNTVIMHALIDRWVEVDAEGGLAFFLDGVKEHGGGFRLGNRWTTIASEYCGRWSLVNPEAAFAAGRSIKDMGILAISMDRISSALASKRPADFFKILNGKNGENVGIRKATAARMLAISNPMEAVAMLERVDPARLEIDGKSLSADVASGWAQSDPEAALAWVRDLDSVEERGRGLRAIAKRLIDVDPDRAALLFKEAKALDGTDSDPRNSGLSFSYDWKNAARLLYEKDPAAAVAWMSKHFPENAAPMLSDFLPKDGLAALEILSTLPDTVLKDGKLSGWPNNFWRPHEAEAALGKLSSVEDVGKRESIRAWLLSGMSSADPVAAIQMAASDLSDPANRAHVFERGMESWARKDIFEAADWLSEQETGAETDAAIVGFSRVAMHLEPDTAIEWVATVSDQELRISQLDQIFQASTKVSGPVVTRNLFAEAQLSQADRKILQEKGMIPSDTYE